MTGIRFERGGTLTGHALRLLEEGPLHTSVLASRVLGISGEAGAAARAVFALLGADPRFSVSADGTWSLGGAAPALRALREESFVVVDVETTGGSPGGGHRVTEVAAVRVEGGEVREHFATLVNPERRIPGMITSLTGITDAMVARAPRFREVAETLAEFLEGRVFVAHNAPFDWGFVRAELAEAVGEVPEMRKLCTVRMTRRLVPRLRRRNLDAVARHFGVPIEGRHRAFGDAFATARILIRLLDEAAARGIPDLATLEAHLAGRHQLQLPFEGRP